MSGKRGLYHHVAHCHDCGATCDARNAMGWAFQHNYRHGHHVGVELGYSVSGPAINPPKPKAQQT